METGIYYDMPEADYHASDALSNSGMKLLLSKSPRHYQYQYLEGNQRDTPALAFGRALHCAVLEPEKFAAEYVVAPDWNKNTNKYKDWKSEQTAQIISASESQVITDICSSIKAKRSALSLLQMDGKNEVSLFAENDGVRFRARIDRLLTAHVAIDLKTCQNASPEGFERDSYNYGYHMQAYFYGWIYECVTGHELKDFVFLCVEKEAPYCVGLYRASPEMLELGKRDVERAIAIYKESQKRGIWFDYDDRIIPLGLPRYAENRLTYGDE